MKSRSTFLKTMVILCLFLLLFSALGIVVLYIGQTAQPVTTSPSQSGFDINELIKAELSGNTLIVDPGQESGDAVVLPQGN